MKYALPLTGRRPVVGAVLLLLVAVTFCPGVGCQRGSSHYQGVTYPTLVIPDENTITGIRITGGPDSDDPNSKDRVLTRSQILEVCAVLKSAKHETAVLGWPFWGRLDISTDKGQTEQVTYYLDEFGNVAFKNMSKAYRTAISFNSFRTMIGAPTITWKKRHEQ